MIKVYRIPISKDQLRQIPKKERGLVFVAGHILNQISVFRKLMQFSMNKDPNDNIEAMASAMQTQILLRSLIGVLAEACVYLEKRQPLIEKSLPSMHEEGREAYGKIKPSFDGKNLLRLIRNNYLYHYPNEKLVDTAFEYVQEHEPWEWYLSETNTNSVYFSCELIFGYGLMKATGEPTQIGAFAVVMAAATDLANTMPDFLMRLIEAIIVPYLGKDIFKPHPGTSIADAPGLKEFWIPFFAETNAAQA